MRFTPDNIVVYRVGTDAAALSSAATAVFLDEYTPGGLLVQSVAAPTVDAGSNQTLTAVGKAASEGLLTLSVDGNIRGAASLDGSQFWETGSNGGVVYRTFGAAGAATSIAAAPANDRAIGTATGTMLNDDFPALTISDPSAVEGNAGGTAFLRYTVTASAPAPAGGLSFTIATADGTATAGSDYVAHTQTNATIAAGQTSYTFDVALIGDTAPERAETVLVNLSAPVRATIADAQGVGTIDNDDGAPAGLQPVFAANFNGFTAAGFAPNPTAAQLDSDVWRVTGLSDNTGPVFGGTYTTGDFARGVINGSTDPVAAGVYSPSANAALIVQPTGAEFENGGFIEAQIVNTTGFTATSFDVAFDWAYRNSGDRADALAFSYSTDGTTFVTVPAAAFTTPGTKDGTTAAATFSLQPETLTIGNVLVGDGNALFLRWTHTGSTGGGSRDEVGIDNVVVRAAVSDIQTLSAADVSVAEGTGGQNFATFTVTRSSGTGTASIAYATADGTALAGRDYTAQSGTLTFAEGERSKTVAVAITTDAANEANETFFLNLSNPVGVSVTDAQARGTITNDDTGPIAIYDIQGAGHVSAFVGQVVATTGIVTAINANSFWLQDTVGDGLFNTSDAVQVFIGAAPTGVAVGDILSLTATVTEFVPLAGALSVTELTAPTFTVTADNGLLPAAVLIGIHGILPPTNVIDDDRLQVFDPQNDGIDFYEALEGMLVTIEAPIVTAATNGRATYVVASGGMGATNVDARGGITLTGDDAAPERVQIFADATLLPGYTPNHTTGDILGNVTGILTYYSFPELLPTQAVTVTRDTTPTQEQTLLTPDADHLQIASFNLENADPTDPQAKFDAIGVEVVTALGRPDIIGLQEVQDADGAGAGTDLSGRATAQKVIDAIVAKGGPTYSYLEIAPPTTNTSGGEPGGNIRNGYLYNADRVGYVAGSVALIQDPAYNNTRKPLVAQFTFNGTTVTVIDQHSTSRGGSDLSFGANQPPAQAGDAARTAQATAIKGYIDALQANDPNAHVVALGDFNGYYYERGLSTLTNDGKLTNLYTLLPVAERYSYVFEGASQAFDNIIVSNNLLPSAQFDVVHYNAEQAVQPITDHDQPVASLYIPRPNAASTALSLDTTAVTENATAGTLVGGGAGNDIYFVDNGGDVITELANEGTDEVRTTLAGYTLGSMLENLTFTGAGAHTGFDNALDNVVSGGAGNDLFSMQGGGTDAVNAGAGDDYVFFGNTFTAADKVDGGSGTDVVGLSGGGNLTLGAQSLVGVERLTLFGGDTFGAAHAGYTLVSNDANVAFDQTLTVLGTSLASDEVLFFDGRAETDGGFHLGGGAAADTLLGGQGADTEVGGAGDDLLYGFAGNDYLVGGAGADTLRGGVGRDLFVYRAAGDSTATATDHILDFEVSQDQIDLSQIDANTSVEGNQAFSFVGSNAFDGGMGELRVYQENGHWFAAADMNGDKAADLLIQVDVVAGQPLGGNDFIL